MKEAEMASCRMRKLRCSERQERYRCEHRVEGANGDDGRRNDPVMAHHFLHY